MEFPVGQYKTIYVDPPWPEYGGGKIKRGADRHYPLMSIREIRDLPVATLIHPEGCHLYLWTTNNYIPQAIEIMGWWDFSYKTCITWVKDRIGLGQYFRGMTEHCLFGTHNSLPYRTTPDGKRAQGKTVFYARRTAHSVKPEDMRQMIELVSYPPYIELFARRRVEMWDVWGNDIKPEPKGLFNTYD